MSDKKLNKKRQTLLVGCGFSLLMLLAILFVVGMAAKVVIEEGWVFGGIGLGIVAFIAGGSYWLLEVWVFGGHDES